MPVAVATVIPGVVVPVTGTVVTQGTISIGTVVAQVGTVAVSTVTSVVALGTIQNAPMVTVQGTVTAAIAATLEVGTIVVGVEGSVVVATILNSPMVTVQGTVTTGDMGTVSIAGSLSGVLGSVTNIGYIGTIQKIVSAINATFIGGTLGTILAPGAWRAVGRWLTRSYYCYERQRERHGDGIRGRPPSLRQSYRTSLLTPFTERCTLPQVACRRW